MRSEEAVKTQVRLMAAKLGMHVWRNNVGACVDANGRQIRYGLANDSAALNREIKSSDLIGITPIIIRPEHVGCKLGVFTAIETKREDWKFSLSDDHAIAQAKFHDIVREAGGYAGFARGAGDIWTIWGY